MAEQSVDLTNCKVLAVDDTPANLEVLIELLEVEGFDVRVAVSGEEALERLSQAEPDIVLLDVMMPGIDGYETCRRLKAMPEMEEVPVIFLTARADLEGVVTGFQAGGADYVTKPFQQEELLARLKSHLERALLRRQLAKVNEQLATANDRLEVQVQERTAELNRRVEELHARDRLAGHMLAVHTLEETLAVVLDVIGQLVRVDQLVAYLMHDGELTAAAATGLAGDALGAQLAERLRADPEASAAIDQIDATPIQIGDAGRRALVPILRHDQLVGLIELGAGSGIPDADLALIGRLAPQIAIAIRDAQVRNDPREWSNELEALLRSEGELDVDEDAQ